MFCNVFFSPHDFLKSLLVFIFFIASISSSRAMDTGNESSIGFENLRTSETGYSEENNGSEPQEIELSFEEIAVYLEAVGFQKLDNKWVYDPNSVRTIPTSILPEKFAICLSQGLGLEIIPVVGLSVKEAKTLCFSPNGIGLVSQEKFSARMGFLAGGKVEGSLYIYLGFDPLDPENEGQTIHIDNIGISFSSAAKAGLGAGVFVGDVLDGSDATAIEIYIEAIVGYVFSFTPSSFRRFNL